MKSSVLAVAAVVALALGGQAKAQVVVAVPGRPMLGRPHVGLMPMRPHLGLGFGHLHLGHGGLGFGHLGHAHFGGGHLHLGGMHLGGGHMHFGHGFRR